MARSSGVARRAGAMVPAKLAWPAAAAIILVVSLAAWVVIAWLVLRAFRG